MQMNCAACKYEHETEYKKRESGSGYEGIVLKGDDAFIELTATVTYSRKDVWYGSDTRVATLYCCPKCHTIKAEL